MEVYLDHNATTPLDPEVLEEMMPYLTSMYGNASSLYLLGRKSRAAITKAREQVAALIGAGEDEVFFTSGGTESCNQAIKGIAYLKETGHIVTSQIEHHAVMHTCQRLEREGFRVTYLPVDRQGRVNPEDVRAAIADSTILIAVMHGNNEIGTLQPVAEIGLIAKERNIPFFSDTVQSVGKVEVNVHKLNVDMLSLSAHKLHGPKGIGALYIRKGLEIRPLLEGGSQERKMRPGTENVASIVGLGKAADLARTHFDENREHMLRLRSRLMPMTETIPAFRLNGHLTETLPGTLNFCARFVDGLTLVMNLSMKGISISTGSACSSGSLSPSFVLKACGLGDEAAHSSVRLSLGRENTEEQMDYVMEEMVDAIEKLRLITAPEDIGACGENCPCFFE
ncbi:MAG: IscS subfamily cysteine desulfurase [Armatimonadetes bacterium]|nr:IscS subfamily cysteine desulfurase [Armatimonadota bacterium]